MVKKKKLEIAVFLCGAVVMIFELVGSRVLAPYLGISIFVWTSLIGVILGSLSIGYWLGGMLADKNPSLKIFSTLVFLSGASIFFTIIVKEPALHYFQGFFNLELSSFISSLILFSPASIFMGMISPYAVKLKMDSLNYSGATVGNLYALSTVGSIAGTFLAGFYLIPNFGSLKILIILAILLGFIAIYIYPKSLIKTKVFFILLLLSSLIFVIYTGSLEKKSGLIDTDTKYSRVFIYPGVDAKTKRKTLNLSFGPYGTQSAIFLEGEDDLVFDYTKYYRLAKYFAPKLKKSLIIGGAGYTYPRDYLKKFPEADLDVVEIDEKLTELAKKYFRLKDNPRLKIFHEDGRAFLNKTGNKYDAIFIDAFCSLYAIPYQLTTKEAVGKTYDALNAGGVAIVNIVSSIEGPSGEFLRAEYATYKSVYPQVYLFPVRKASKGEVGNIILVGLKSNAIPSFQSDDSELNEYLKNLYKEEIKTDMPVLTDDFAPVDYYARKAV
ncbi:MAG: fused MFS/spermidine synthase [Patescibacteria group bacterium]|jgi:spermidine synthase